MKNIIDVKEILLRITTAILDGIFPPHALERQARAITPADLATLLRMRDIPTCKATALFDYKNEMVKHLVWLLKYKKNKHAATLFAAVLHDMLAETLGDVRVFKSTETPLLIPIPLSKKRYRERGYNQTELLAKALVTHAGNGWYEYAPDILVKIKETPPQTSLTEKNARMKNIRDAFGIANQNYYRERIKNRTIILLDDVTTTGATLSEARRPLEHNGFNNIIAIALAH